MSHIIWVRPSTIGPRDLVIECTCGWDETVRNAPDLVELNEIAHEHIEAAEREYAPEPGAG